MSSRKATLDSDINVHAEKVKIFITDSQPFNSRVNTEKIQSYIL